MEMKCTICNSILSSSNLKFSCSHFLCNKCLSRKLLLTKFSSLSNTKQVEMNCSCGGKITIEYKTCLNNIIGEEIQKKKNKYCKKHKEKSDTYCPICRLWLCPECISSFHTDYFSNHKLCPEDKMITSKCFYHRDFPNELFCKTCNKLICQKCRNDTSDPENNHNNHAIFTLDNYHKAIKNKKKHLKYKSYDEIMRFIDTRENEITKDFQDKCEESKTYIEEAIKQLEDIKDNYISKYNLQIDNLKNIFSIVRQAYANFYKEMEGDKIDLYSFDFISNINDELNNISYKPINFDLIKNIHTSLNKINKSMYYNIKFNFKKLFYEKIQEIEGNEGVTSICVLKCIPNAFACGTSNGKIQIYQKKDDYEYTLVGESKENKGINILIELKKTEKTLLSGSNDKNIRLWNIDSTKNNNNFEYNIVCRKEIYNEGSVLSIFELSDGRIASSTSDDKIKIWSVDSKNKNENEILIENKNKKLELSFESCLSEGAIFQHDENNKQLISGGRNGKLKCWDIYSGQLGKIFECRYSNITCLININNHTLVVGFGDGAIVIIDLFDENKKVLYGHSDIINSMCYIKDKNNLFSCSKDMTIKIWDLEILKCTNTLYRQHKSRIYGVIICGNDLVSCSNDGVINVYTTGEDNKNENNNKSEENYDEENYDKFE